MECQIRIEVEVNHCIQPPILHVTFPFFSYYSTMIARYLKTIFIFFIVLQSAAQESGQQQVVLYPFEDYSNCQNGFISISSWPRDTIYPAKFENLREIGDVFWKEEDNRQYHIQNWILSENGKFGCLSDRNEWFVNCVYEGLSYDHYSKQFIVKQNGKVGTMDLNKKIIFPFEFDEIYTEYPLVAEYNGGKPDWDMGAIDELFARKNGLLGVYSKKAEEIIAPQFDSIQTFYFVAKHLSNDIVNKRFYRVYKNNQVGLYNSNGKLLIPVEYRQLELLYSGQLTSNAILFLATDSKGLHTVMDEYGNVLTPFSKYEYRREVTLGTSQEFNALKFVLETDPETKSERITRLGSGKTSEWYPKMKLTGDWIWVESGDRWLVLDTNFKKMFSQKKSTDQLFYFDYQNELVPANTNQDPTEESPYRFYTEYDYTVPQVFVIERKDTTENAQKTLYGLVNVATGKQSSVSYDQIIRMETSTTYYYWSFYGAKNFSEIVDYVSIDIYDNAGKLVNSIQTYWDKQDLITPDRSIHKYHSYCTPFVRSSTANEKYTIHGLDGWQPKFNEFEDGIAGIWKLGKASGYIQFYDKNYHHYFTDFNGKPLLGGRHYELMGYPQVEKWVIGLKDSSNSLFVNEKLEVLMDSCEIYAIDYPKHKGLDNTRNSIFAVNNEHVYVLDIDTFKLMDAKMFAEPAANGMNEISRNFYVDGSGKIISKEQVDRYLKSKPQNYGYMWLWIENDQLKIEDQNHRLIKTIPNVFDYKPDYSEVITVISTDKKKGLIRYRTGEWLLKPMYDDLYFINHQYQRTLFAKDKRFQDTCWFVINENGDPITKPVFDKPFGFDYGKYWTYVQSNGLWGTINRNYEWKTLPKYTEFNESNDIVVMKGSEGYVIVNDVTGESFLAPHDSVVRILNSYSDKIELFYAFLFNDSLQVLDVNGKELLPATKISDVINKQNLGKILYKRDGVAILEAFGDHIDCPESNTFFVRLNNELIIENIRHDALPCQHMGSYVKNGYSACSRSATFVNEKIYSERIEGECYEHPENLYSYYDKFSFRTYWIENNSFVRVNRLSDLFATGANYEPILDKLIERAIQEHQIFGTACADIPAAVTEFKRNFYFDRDFLSFVYFDGSDEYYIGVPMDQLSGMLKYPNAF